MRSRLLIFASASVATGGIAGLGAYLATAGLNKASAVAGVVVAFVELVALVIGVYGITRERRATADSQVIVHSSIGGEAAQIRGVKGSVHIHRGGERAAGAEQIPQTTGDSNPSTEVGQSVTNSRISGNLNQIQDIGGDIEVD